MNEFVYAYFVCLCMLLSCLVPSLVHVLIEFVCDLLFDNSESLSVDYVLVD